MQIKHIDWHHTEPITMLALGGATLPGKAGFEVIAEDNGQTLYFSRLEHENDWTCDGAIVTKNCYPIYMNGWGSRCTLLRKATPSQHEVLTAAAWAWAVDSGRSPWRSAHK